MMMITVNKKKIKTVKKLLRNGVSASGDGLAFCLKCFQCGCVRYFPPPRVCVCGVIRGDAKSTHG